MINYSYDNLGRAISASQSGNALGFGYDALGRTLTQAGPHGTITSAYDIAGNRTRITHPDGFYVDQDFLVTGEMAKIREYGATTGVGVLATFAYDDLGRRTSLNRGNGTTASYAYDAASRLASLSENLTGTSYDQTLGFSYNPAGQITGNTRANDAYAWAGHGSGSTASTANGLNQLASVGGVTPAYDARGNMTYDGVRTFGYSSENLLASASGGVTLAYDPLTRLYQTGGAVTARFAYDASALFAEYDGGNALQRRYVHGPGTDEPLVWYEGAGTSGRRFLHADERGSIVAVSDSAGTVIGVNKYDEYGKPAPANIGRFQYTGQAWLPELGLYYYKNRMYHPALGRFLQPDPIGYEGGPNLNNYVGSDPVNSADPEGLAPKRPNIVCTGTRIASGCGGGGIAGGLSGSSSAGVGGQAPSPGEGVGSGGGWVKVSTPVYSEGNDIVVTAPQYVWVSSGLPFYFNGSRYVSNPHYKRPEHADYVDYGFVVGPPLVGLVAAAVPEAVAIEGATVGYARYGSGRAAQIRIMENKLYFVST